MNISDVIGKCRNKGSVNPADKFVVVNSATGEPLESHFTEKSAVRARDICNEHEVICGRPEVYVYEAIDK